MLPVISYKVGGDVAGAINGTYNAVAEQAAAKLASYGLPTAVTFWHEPNSDLTAAQYAAASKQILPYFKRGELRVGPILNGWLLDNQLATFAPRPDELFALWDYVGIDTYEAGTTAAPRAAEARGPDRRWRSSLASRGYDHPIGVGEYNGYSATTIAAAGEALLGTPNVWFGILWNAAAEVDGCSAATVSPPSSRRSRTRAPPSRSEHTGLTAMTQTVSRPGIGGSGSEGGAGTPGADRTSIWVLLRNQPELISKRGCVPDPLRPASRHASGRTTG